MSINNLETQYIKTCDGHVGVIIGETKTQIIAIMPWDTIKGETRFMKDSHRQVGTKARSFDYVQSFSEV